MGHPAAIAVFIGKKIELLDFWFSNAEENRGIRIDDIQKSINFVKTDSPLWYQSGLSNFAKCIDTIAQFVILKRLYIWMKIFHCTDEDQ